MKDINIRKEVVVATKGMGDNKVESTCSEVFVVRGEEEIGIAITANDTDYLYWHEAASEQQINAVKKLVEENPDKFWDFFDYYAGPRDWNGNFPMIHRFEDKWSVYFEEDN